MRVSITSTIEWDEILNGISRAVDAGIRGNLMIFTIEDASQLRDLAERIAVYVHKRNQNSEARR